MEEEFTVTESTMRRVFEKWQCDVAEYGVSAGMAKVTERRWAAESASYFCEKLNELKSEV